MKLRHGVGLVLLLVAGLVIWRWLHDLPSTTTSAGAASSATQVETVPNPYPAPPPLEWIDGGRPTDKALETGRRHADWVRARLASQRGNAANVPSMPAPVGSAGQNQVGTPLGDYLADVVHREFFPMAETCYRDLLHKHPDSGGSILLDVAIIGDGSVGGVVDSVQVDAASALAQTEFVTCVRESMMAMSFKAPPGGRVTFTLPLDFAP